MLQIYKHTCNKVNNFTCLTENNFYTTFARMTIGKRLKIARKHAGLTQAQLADALKGIMTQQNISLLESETTTGTEYIVQLAVACGVSSEWLALGKGQMTNDNIPYKNTPEYQVYLAMQNMDEWTKYQVVKISNSLVEPKLPPKNNGTEK